ncbi:MAG TPA: YibE/F family protein [Acidimicrobiia bacterium]|nr:YibE/F family protein [Acidimicrobiia bacterium]
MPESRSDFEVFQGPDTRLRADWLVVTIVTLGAMTVIGLFILWPRGQLPFDRDILGLVDTAVPAQVTSALDGRCTFASDLACHAVTFEILDGDDAGTLASQEFDVSSSSPRFAPGDRVILSVIEGAEPSERYQYSDRDRRFVLWLLAACFAAAVVGLGRLKGLAALGGLMASVLVLVVFIAPAILAGRSPVLVAAVGGSAIALLALYLAHGWSPLTHVAAIGTFAALALTVILSALVMAAARFSGFASEEAFFLTLVEGLDIRGLVLAGTVLGTIGALDDITVTQASTVFELHRANPSSASAEIFASGLRVGRDHIASTVNTLLLAYAGAAMPLLLLFTLSDLPIGIVANSEVVAVEIVRTLVGSIGLVAAVPFTTWLAARLATSGPLAAPTAPGG